MSNTTAAQTVTATASVKVPFTGGRRLEAKFVSSSPLVVKAAWLAMNLVLMIAALVMMIVAAGTAGAIAIASAVKGR